MDGLKNGSRSWGFRSPVPKITELVPDHPGTSSVIMGGSGKVADQTVPVIFGTSSPIKVIAHPYRSGSGGSRVYVVTRDRNQFGGRKTIKKLGTVSTPRKTPAGRPKRRPSPAGREHTTHTAAGTNR